MSAILEENIGFGGNDSNIQPYPPKDSVNLDPLLQEARRLRAESKLKELKHTITQDSLNKGKVISQKNFEETKQLIQSVNEKMASYPKHYLSYEGSMVVCVLLSMHESANVPLSSLPQKDQTLIKSIIPDEWKDETYIVVQFDKEKDFIISLMSSDEKISPHRFTMFNTVAHPRPEDLTDTSKAEVKIEEKEGTINLGGAITYDKKRLANLAAVSPRDNRTNEVPEPPSILKTTNRNAYEIRADVLQMAIDWARREENPRSDDQLLELAKKFYTFVENRR